MATIDEQSAPATGFGRTARTAFALALEGAMLACGAGTVLLGHAARSLVEKNQLPSATRTALVVSVIVAAVLPVVLTFVLYRRPRWDERLDRLAAAAAFVIPVGLGMGLLVPGVWTSRALTFLIVLAALVPLFEATFEHSLSVLLDAAKRPRFEKFAITRRQALVIATVLGGAYVVCTSVLTIMSHRRFGTGAYDLAIFDNMMFNGLSGHPFRSTVMFGNRVGNAIADHAHYAEVVFIPLYALWRSAEMLLALQAALLGLAAIPLYLFAERLVRPVEAILVVIAYLLYAPLHGAQFYDFHWLPLGVFFYFLLFYALIAEKRGLGIVAVLFLFALREDLAPGVAAVGLTLLAMNWKPSVGVVLVVTSVLWTGLNKFVLMPLAGPWWFVKMYDTLVPPGEKDWSGVFRTLLSNPSYVLASVAEIPKIEYLLHMLVPVAFLPLRRAWLMPLLLPGVLFTVLTNWSPAYSIRYQYTTHWIPFVFGAAVLALHAIGKKDGSIKQAAASLTLAAVCAIHSATFGAIFVPDSFVGAVVKPAYSMTLMEHSRYDALHRLIDLIPPNAAVSSTDVEAPHLSNRRNLFAVAQDDSPGEYVLANIESLHLARSRQNLKNIFSTATYGLIAEDFGGKMLLFHRDEDKDPAKTAAAKQSLDLPK